MADNLLDMGPSSAKRPKLNSPALSSSDTPGKMLLSTPVTSESLSELIHHIWDRARIAQVFCFIYNTLAQMSDQKPFRPGNSRNHSGSELTCPVRNPSPVPPETDQFRKDARLSISNPYRLGPGLSSD